MMPPTTPQDWIAVANERAADAQEMLPNRNDSVGPVYMAGYAVECSLKAYLQRLGRPFPQYGREGHDLRSLWSSAGFRLADLSDSSGVKSFFVESWSTDLRYEIQVDSSIAAEDLVSGAGKLKGWIQNQIRRARR